MKKGLKWILRIIEALVIIYVIFMTTCILLRNKYGFTQFDNNILVSVTKNNAKFLTKYNVGDLLVIDNSVNTDINDEIYYYEANNDEYVVKSGTVSSKTGIGSDSVYVLKGDKQISVAGGRVVGKDPVVYKGLGSKVDFLTSRIGFLIFVLLPVLVIFIYQIYDLVVVAKYEEVDDKKETSVPQEEPEIKQHVETKIEPQPQTEVKEETNDDVEML